MTKAYLERFFGDKVGVEYYDMAVPEHYAQRKALLEGIVDDYRVYPMVFVNGELVIVGSAEYYDVLGAVREVLAAVES